MKKFLLTLALSFAGLLFSAVAGAQNYNSPLYQDPRLELSVGAGPMFFLGDLGGHKGVGQRFLKDLNIPVARPAINASLAWYPSDWFGIRLSATYGAVAGDDALAPAAGGAEMDRKDRNLNFKSAIAEGSLQAEFYPTVFMEKYAGLFHKLRPYITGGVGLFHFNPKARLATGQWVATRPLHLEGQGFPEYPDAKPYDLTQKNLLLGFGFKYYVRDNFFIGFEVLYRKLFTDYVDDVSHNYYVDPITFDRHLSPDDARLARSLYYRGNYSFATSRPYQQFAERGNPKQNDAYFSTLFRMGWRFAKKDPSLRQFRCPVYY